MSQPENNILLGTSGWSYKEWVGPFYSKEDKSFLKAYTRAFKTVEIDSTFYRYPSKGTVMGWARYSPEGFVYSAKLPKLITHEKKLDLAQDVDKDLQRFLELMEPVILSGKLGCFLIQLPPKFDYNINALEDFLKILPTSVRFAVEFRDPSWLREETWALLEKYRTAYTVVDEPLLPPELHLTSDIAYFRWHGHGTTLWYDYHYELQELEPWIRKVKEASGKLKRVYGYFNNHFHGYAVENCLQVLEMLGALSDEQIRAKVKIENYFKKLGAFKETKLEAFVGSPQTKIDSLLLTFTDMGRLERAKSIDDDEISIKRETNNLVEARIRDYHIAIDLDAKTIVHDCDDWKKGLPNRRFCKHIGKLFLFMDKAKAESLLTKISEEKHEWQFKPAD